MIRSSLIILSVTVVLLFTVQEYSIAAENRAEDQLSDLENRYDERLKALEGRISLLTQKDDEIKTLVQALTSTTKSADPNAVSEVAKHAIAAATEGVKHIESFYATAGTQLGIFLGVIALIAGWLGIKQFKGAAQELLDTELKTFKKQVRQSTDNYQKIVSEYTEARATTTKLTTQLEDETRAVTKLREDIETDRNDARRNIEALTATSSAYVTVTYCLIQLPQTTDANIKTKLIANCDSALNTATNVIDKYKPTDSNILAWAFTIRGTVLHLREDFEAALEINPDRGPTLYNAACSACRLGFEKKALSYIKRALEIQPGRRDEARTDPDLDAVHADI